MPCLTAPALFRVGWNRGAPVAFVDESISVMRIALGQIMAQTFAGNRRLSSRATGALVFGAALMLSPAMFSTTASAQLLGYASPSQSSFPSDNMTLAPTEPALSDDGSGSVVPERLRRFLDLSGLDPANLREAAADPGFLLGILDYVSGDEALLVAFATDAGIDANAIETARRLLSNGS